PPVDAIAAGTWAARAWLGTPGLDEGAPADLVVYASDPRQGARTLTDPRRIVLNGRVVGELVCEPGGLRGVPVRRLALARGSVCRGSAGNGRTPVIEWI